MGLGYAITLHVIESSLPYVLLIFAPSDIAAIGIFFTIRSKTYNYNTVNIIFASISCQHTILNKILINLSCITILTIG